MRISPRLRFVSALIAFVLLAAACGGSEDTDDASPADSPSESSSAAATDVADDEAEPEPTPADDEDAGEGDTTESTTTEAAPEPPVFPRTVTDGLGEVEIPEAPTTVVVLDQALLDIALVLELEIIGYTTFRNPDGDIPALYTDAAAEFAADAEWMGDTFAPSFEAVAAAQPDMILNTAGRPEQAAMQPTLAQIAPTVMTASAGAGWKEALMLIAEATGREAIAEAALEAYEARADRIGAAINEAHDDPTLSVVRFVDVIRLYQPVSFSGTVLADAGIARPESQQDQENFITIISEEELPLADGDWLVYAVFPDQRVEEAVAERSTSPLWTMLSAVQNEQVFAVDDDEWMSGVGLFGALAILDDLESIFGVDGG